MKVRADAFDQDRHFVGDQAHVGGGWGQHGQATALTGGRHKQKRILHLNDGLAYSSSAKVAAGSAGKALHAGRDCRQVLGILPAEIVGGAGDQAIAGKDHGLVDLMNPGDQVVEQPAQVTCVVPALAVRACAVIHLNPRCHSTVRLFGYPWPRYPVRARAVLGAPPPSSADTSKTDRPRSQPCWMALIVERASSGEGTMLSSTTGAVIGSIVLSRSCGARLACRTRRGRSAPSGPPPAPGP